MNISNNKGEMLCFPFSWLDNELSEFTAEEIGKLILSIKQYHESGEMPQDPEDRFLRVVYKSIFRQYAAIEEAYKKKCELNRENGKKGGRPTKTRNYENTGFMDYEQRNYSAEEYAAIEAATINK